MLDDTSRQQTNGEDHKHLPLGNTDPQFGSALPPGSEMLDYLAQAKLARGIRELPPGLYQVRSHLKSGSIVFGRGGLGLGTAAPAAAPAPPLDPSVKAKDLELAGEVALFREIMKDWDFTDHQASAVLGYKESTFAAELFRGLVSIRQRDADERLQLVITIAVDLEALFRDRNAIRDWLRRPHELLGGATPLAMATEGTSLDMLKLSEYVEYLSGR